MFPIAFRNGHLGNKQPFPFPIGRFPKKTAGLFPDYVTLGGSREKKVTSKPK